MSMRIQVLLSTVLLLAGTLLAGAREYAVRGPQGGMSMTETLPDGFDPQTQKCPMERRQEDHRQNDRQEDKTRYAPLRKHFYDCVSRGKDTKFWVFA